jgi:hypothetical protein
LQIAVVKKLTSVGEIVIKANFIKYSRGCFREVFK